MFRKYLLILIIIFLSAVMVAAVPSMLNYRGKLFENGQPVNGMKNITFRVYNAVVGPTELWNSGLQPININNGYYHYTLNIPSSVFTNNAALYLEIDIQGTGALTPREQLVASGYAINADMVDGYHAANISPWKRKSNNIYFSNGFAGLGTSIPYNTFHIVDQKNAVSGSSIDTSELGLVLTHPQSVNGNGTGLGFNVDAATTDRIGAAIVHYRTGNNSQGGLYFGVKSTTSAGGTIPIRMTLDQNGRVGIKTNTPAAEMHIVNNLGIDSFRVDDQDADTTPFVINSSGRAGIGTATPSYKLDVIGTNSMTGFHMTPNAANGRVLTTDASGFGTWQALPAGLSGTGTVNYLPLFLTSSSLTSSILKQTNSRIGLSVSSPAAKMHILNTGTIPSFRVDDQNADTTSFIISTNGNVGIGTDPSYTPPAKLYVENGNIDVQRYDSLDTELNLYGDNNGRNWVLANQDSGNGELVICDSYIPNNRPNLIMFGSYGAAFSTNNNYSSTYHFVNRGAAASLRVDDQSGDTTPFVIDASGQVGIGLAAPASILQVSGDEVRIGSGGTLNYISGNGELYVQNDLEVDGTIYGAVSGTFNPGFTTGSVIFQGAANLAQDNANFFWDDTNNRLGLGTAVPSQQLTLTGSLRLPTTTSSNEGTVYVGANKFIHTYGTVNLFIGVGAGNFTLSGANYNTGIGYQSLFSLVDGDYNVGLGYRALYSVTSGLYNVGIGNSALYGTTTGNYNVAVGYAAGSSATGNSIVGIGYQALYQNTGSYNVGIGANTIYYGTGNYNTAIGYWALNGGSAGAGARNVAIGYHAGDSVTTGNDNILFGYYSGQLLSTTSRNIMMGYYTGYNAIGNDNILIGYQAGYNFDAMNKNLMIGNYAGYNSEGSNNIFIGHYAGYSEAGSGKLYIDQGNTTTPLIYGDLINNTLTVYGALGVNTNAPQDPVHVKSDTAAEAIRINENSGPDYWQLGVDSGGALVYRRAAMTYMMFSSTGDLGIGSAPMRNLEIARAVGPTFGLNRVDTTIVAGEVLGEIAFTGNTGGTSQIGAAIRAYATQTWAASDYPTELRFYTAPDAGTEQVRMILNRDGVLQVGAGTINYATTAGEVYIQNDLEVDGTIYGSFSSGYTPGSVIFQGTAYLAQDNANFFWDDANNRLGIGTAAPAEQLQITGNFRLPTTSTSNAGVIFSGSTRFIHAPGTLNLFVGLYAGNFTMSGATYNTGIGPYALSALVGGDYNTGLGYYALGGITDGTYNVGIGVRALFTCDTGTRNTAVGYNTLRTLSAGSDNTGLGYFAGYDCTGNRNVFIGSFAGYNTTSGSGNVVIGYYAGYTGLTTGHSNVFIGTRAGMNETGSKLLYIDNTDTSTPLIWGDFANDVLAVNGQLGIGTTIPSAGYALHVNGIAKIDGAIQAQDATGVGMRDDAGVYGIWVEDGAYVGIGTTNPLQKFYVFANVSGGYAGYFFNDGGTDTYYGIGIQCGRDDSASANEMITFFDGDGTEVGDIMNVGGNINYNAFTGGHYGEIKTADILDAGDVLVQTGSVRKADPSQKEGGEPVYEVQRSFQAKDKKVIGVFAAWKDDKHQKNGNNNGNVIIFAVGNAYVKVTDANGDIEAGDYLTTSDRPGLAQKQDEASQMNFTLGKAQETVRWKDVKKDPKTGYKWKRIPVALTAG